MAANDVRIVITADGKQAQRELKDTESATKGLGSAFTDMAKVAGGIVLGAGILKAPGLLMDAAKAAIEDEQATKRLEQALQNVGGAFGDNIKAVNERIAAGQKLAFTDDQVRDSFQILLAATGDVNEALTRQKVAMDLARGAGIPLEQASKLLGKVTEDNVEQFKRLGITIGEGATEAEALAVIQEKFAGQSEAYAKSTAGQFEQFKIRLSEVMETVGSAVLPMLTALGGVLLDTVVPALESGAKKIVEFVAPFKEWATEAVQAAMKFFTDVFIPAAKELAGLVWTAVIEAFNAIADAVKRIAETPGFQTFVDSVKDFSINAGKATGDTNNWAAAWEKLKGWLQQAYDILKPFVDVVLVTLKTEINLLIDRMAPLIQAVKDLWEALKPLQPLLEAIGILLGVTLVAVIGTLILFLGSLAAVFIGTVIVAVEATRLAIIGLTKIIEGLTAVVEAVAPTMKSAGEMLFRGLWDGISFIWDTIISPWFIGLGSEIIGKIGDAGSILYDVGKALVKGFFSGIIDAFNGGIGNVIGKLDPRGWDIPGLSPFEPAMEHAGQKGGDRFVTGFVNALGILPMLAAGIVSVAANAGINAAGGAGTNVPVAPGTASPGTPGPGNLGPNVGTNGNVYMPQMPPAYVIENSPYLKKARDEGRLFVAYYGGWWNLKDGPPPAFDPAAQSGIANYVGPAGGMGGTWGGGSGTGGGMTINLVLDGQVLATAVVNQLNKQMA